MQVRIIKINRDNKKENRKLISYFEIDEKTRMNEFIKSLCEIKKIQEKNPDLIGLELNTEDVVDTFGEWYDIDSITLNIPKPFGEILPYIAVYVTPSY